MADSGSLSARVSTVLNTLGPVAATVVRSPRSTVEPPREARHGKKALAVLRGLTHDPRGLIDEGVLGEGGMGVVKLARQVALDRPVAVKTLKQGGDEASEALLSEALLAGALEHPGIMPIYALSLDADGRPLLVMRLIEGVTWSALLSGAAELSSFAPGRSRLESHVRIAIQLCNALHFAHARGVVHRDVKPDNVMLGHFGEVYLMDWGIATEAGPSEQFAGTPAYMAPEMMGGSEVTARTDVYLVGAVLTEIVTGKPPHLRETVPSMLESVLRSQVELPADVPDELAQLIRRCTAANANERPESALVLRQALEAFLEHQGSRELAAQSEARAAELEALLATPAPDAVQVSRLFTECRFGLQQALRAWPGNTAASSRLQSVIERMVRFELASGAPRVARTLLAELSNPSAALLEEVRRGEDAERAKAEELTRLQRLAESYDPLTGATRRIGLGMVLGLLWVLGPAFRQLLGREGILSDDLLVSAPVAAASTLILIIAGRKTPAHLRTPLNEQIGRLLSFSMFMQVVTSLTLSLVLDVSFGIYGMAVLIWYWTLVAGLVSTLLVRQVWPAVASYALGTIAAIRWPENGNVFASLSNLGLYVNIIGIYFWQKRVLAQRASERQGERQPNTK